MKRSVAIVGAGPAGLYLLAALLKSTDFSHLTVFESAPAPFGLIRYGVAPDHPRTRRIATILAKSFTDPRVRFVGNVQVGRDITLQQLRDNYDVVAVSAGMRGDRRLGIPGEDLPSSYGSSELVAWYTGLPDAPNVSIPSRVRSVAVIGAGNVALDIARILTRDETTLRGTSMPRHVVRALTESGITDVHIVARRGPAQAKFTSPELHEIGALDNVDVVVNPDNLALDAADEEQIRGDRKSRVIVDLCRTWSGESGEGKHRRIHLHFWRRPVRIYGEDDVTALELEPTRSASAGPSQIPVEMVVRAIGYQGAPIPGLPYASNGTVPSHDGRVITDDAPVPGLYVTGWLRRGPSGVIATNRGDANEVSESVLADIKTLSPCGGSPEKLDKILVESGGSVITWEDWLRLETYEKLLGEASESDPITVHDLDTIFTILREQNRPL